MAGTSIIDQSRMFGKQQPDDIATQFGALSTKFDDLLTYLKGGEIGGVSGSPIQLGRSVIKDIKKGAKTYRTEELPDLYNRYIKDVGAGRLTPSQASAAYEAAARGAGQIEGTVKKAGELADLLPGAPSAKQYERYTPFFQGTAQSMLGRTFTEPEIQNYISTFRGMGIKDPGDVSAAFGKLLTTSDEYQARQYRFKPEMPTLNTGGAEAFAKMLYTSFG